VVKGILTFLLIFIVELFEDIVSQVIVPVNVGLAILAFLDKASTVRFETTLFASDVLSTLLKPTIDLVIPVTVELIVIGDENVDMPLNVVDPENVIGPVNVGDAIGAFLSI
jgi:hypothetical protein